MVMLYGEKMKKYKFKEYNKNSKDYKFSITDNGHTMMPYDIIERLNDKELLLKQNKELEKQNEESIIIIKELKSMIYKSKSPVMDGSNRFDVRKADKLLNQIYALLKKQKPIEEILEEGIKWRLTDL